METEGAFSFKPYSAARGLDQRMALPGFIRAVARLEAPISLSLLYQDAASYLGEPRVDADTRTRVLRVFEEDASKEFSVAHDFVYAAGTTIDRIAPRKKGRRTFSDIAPLELGAGVLVVLKELYPESGARTEELYSSVMKAFGFNNVTNLARLRIASANSTLKKLGLIKTYRGRLYLKE